MLEGKRGKKPELSEVHEVFENRPDPSGQKYQARSAMGSGLKTYPHNSSPNHPACGRQAPKGERNNSSIPAEFQV